MQLVERNGGIGAARLIDIEQQLKVVLPTDRDRCRHQVGKSQVMCPRSGLIIEWCSARGIIALFIRVVLNAQKRLNDPRTSRLRLGEVELGGAVRVGDRASVTIDQINDGGASAGGE